MREADDKNLNTAEDPHPEDANKEGTTPSAEIEIDDPPAELTQDPLDPLVAHINALFVRKGLEVVLEIGRFVLETVFGGDLTLVADRGKDHPTFRALAERDDLLMSHTSIWRAVRIVLQLPALPEEAAMRLPSTHHAMLLPVRDEATKADLAQLALDEGLSSREFEAWVKEARQKEKVDKRGGRKRLPAFVKTVHKVEKLAKDDGLWGDLDAIDELDADKVESLHRAVTTVKIRCEVILRALDDKVPDSEAE